jgi:hypothetical protein
MKEKDTQAHTNERGFFGGLAVLNHGGRRERKVNI